MRYRPRRYKKTLSQHILANYKIDRAFLFDSRLFDADFYLSKYTVPGGFKGDALDHFLVNSASYDSDPNEYFSTSFYRRRYSDISSSEQIPLLHYIKHGASELRDPSETFSTSWYIISNPDVAANGLNPLAHFLRYGRNEERSPIKPPRSAMQRLAERYRSYGDIGAATLTDLRIETPEIADRLAPRTPLNVFPDDRLNARPHLNILIPSLQMRHASGGPNTAFILGILLARTGLHVRFLATDAPMEDTSDPIKCHIERLTGFHPDDLFVELVDACSRQRAVPVGRNDIFLATAWWTAQMAWSVSNMLHHKRFLYLIQDYESLFYGAGENLVDAAETYDFDFFPVINCRFLRDHLVAEKIGRFADAAFSERAAVFDPAVDRDFYKVASEQVKRRLLFYARPTIAARNLFGLGVAALRAAIEAGAFSVGGWEFVGMGETFEPIDLGRGHVLRSAPWLGFAEYARQMRESHVLLSLMLSPHPSYPPLEMAACGGKVVTTVFGSKTAQALSALSPNIIGVRPKIEDLVDGLFRAVTMDDDPRAWLDEQEAIALPRSWSAALSSVLPTILGELATLGLSPLRNALPPPRTVIRASEEIKGSLERHITSAALRRRANARVIGAPRLSVVTMLDRDHGSLVDLAHTVLGQTPLADVDWLIVAVGAEVSFIEEIFATQAGVRCQTASSLHEGLRWCLESARGDYTVFTHADGKLFPDALHAISSFLLRAGLPACAVTATELVNGDGGRENDDAADLLRALLILRRSKALDAFGGGDSGSITIQSVGELARHVSLNEQIHVLDDVLYSLRLADVMPSSLVQPSACDHVDIPCLACPSERDDRSKNDAHHDVARISILTLLYHGSDPALFLETADSVRHQTCAPFEWIVLAQGAVDPRLASLLRTLQEEKLLRLICTDRNRGIAIGLRQCLKMASGDMAFWLDGDDLLSPIALEVLSKATRERPDTVIFYTDEDILIGSELQHVFHRPDFDPALVLSHSYVYHLIVFRRDLALNLGAFTSENTQYAQDWDILVRFYLAGLEAIHIPQVLVHWRHHAKSTSGNGSVFDGSLESIKGVLSMIIDQTKTSMILEVATYPIELGTPDFYIKRFPINPPCVRRLDLGSGESTSIQFPFAARSCLVAPTKAGLAEAAREATEDFTMLCGTEIFGVDAVGLWQADKHFQLVPSCVAVGGPITDAAAKVVYGGPVRIDDWRLVDPQAGHFLSNAGPFSINLKPHCVDALALDLLVLRSAFLREALEACPDGLAFFDIGVWLGAFAQLRGRHLVYEPLLRGRCRSPDRLMSDSAEGLSIASRYPIAKTFGDGERPLVIHGTGGFARAEAQAHVSALKGRDETLLT